MKIFTRATVAFYLCFISLGVAQAVPKSKAASDKTITEYLTITKSWDRIRLRLRNSLKTNYKNDKITTSTIKNNKALKEAERELYVIVFNHLRKNLEATTAKEIIGFYKSPSGKKFMKFDESFNSRVENQLPHVINNYLKKNKN